MDPLQEDTPLLSLYSSMNMRTALNAPMKKALDKVDGDALSISSVVETRLSGFMLHSMILSSGEW